MKYKILIISILTLAFPANCFPQWTNDSRITKNAITIEPLYLYNFGLRINYERQISTPKHWVEFSAVGYFPSSDDFSLSHIWFYDDSYYYNRNVKTNWGTTFEVAYKYYPLSFIYLASGLSYNHHEAKFEGFDTKFNSYIEDGLLFYEPAYKTSDCWESFDRVGLNLRLGMQTPLYRRFVVGCYVGLSYNYSFFDENNFSSEDKSVTTVYYRGFVPSTGFRIGVRF
ncbi:MAG: hypothetical protein LBR64_03855 [Dysgonamonadaceae bacterium]|jgi:hypothetical protein|nr:hypothetical protein [Dysgonamonadaceae bacterium]